jgi:hypothetical protein
MPEEYSAKIKKKMYKIVSLQLPYKHNKTHKISQINKLKINKYVLHIYTYIYIYI